MSLPVSQRRALKGIERTVLVSDPGLASRFAIFGRLSQGEAMPTAEQLPDRAPRRRPGRHRSTRRAQSRRWVTIAVLTLLAFLLIAVAALQGSSRCGLGRACSRTSGSGSAVFIPGR